MKKFLIVTAVIAIIAFFWGCKFQEEGYTVMREWDAGTFYTKRGVVKYLSSTPDTAISISDVYAKVTNTIRYARVEDSIVMYGHCWSKSPDVRLRDTMSTRFYTENYSELQYGTKVQSTLAGLEDETDYYVRSYVVTGKRQGDNIIAKDTAYNPVELLVRTDDPKNLWEERPELAQGQPYLGAISFTYNGKLYTGLGHNESVFDKIIFEYDPVTKAWNEFTSLPTSSGKFSNAVCFIVKGVQIQTGVYRDFLYVGTGLTDQGDATDEFWRYDLKNDTWVELRDGSKFSGGPRQNAVAFSVNGKGYVALGTINSGAPVESVYEFDPEYADVSGFYPQGKWKKVTSFPGGKRTQAIAFTIGDIAYIGCGQNETGIYKKDFWSMSLTVDEEVSWARKREFPGTARIEAVGMNIGEMGFIGTGLDADSLRSDYWRYNPFVNDWDERAKFLGKPRMEAMGIGLEYAPDDFRGFLGLGVGPDIQDYYLDLWEYRP